MIEITTEIEKNIEAYFMFINERESIRVKKEDLKLPKPWTTDNVLRTYSFTNVKRENDKTTRWAVDNWYTPNLQADPRIQMMACAIFRWFGTTEFASQHKYPIERFDPHYTISVAEEMLKKKKKVFTGAYIITNGGISGPKQNVVCKYYLEPFWKQIPYLLDVTEKYKSWEAVARNMSTIPGFGGSGFMTKEVLLDVFHTSIFNDVVDKKTWTPVGPGARRGLNRIFRRPVDYNVSASRGLAEIRKLQEYTLKYWRYPIELYTTDIQFQLCEFDKYQRVMNGEGRPRSTYKG